MTSLEDVVADQERHLAGARATGFDLLHEAVLRHPDTDVALVHRAGDTRRVTTYGQLAEQAGLVAGRLTAAGVGEGDRVAVLLPKRPALLATLYGVWSLGASVVPLFTAFGPDGVATRVRAGQARLVVTDVAHRDRVPPATTVLDVDADGPVATPPPPRTRPADREMILIFTSGTTGPPKGVPVPLVALPAFRAYLQHSVDLRPDDILWNMADPGWAYGLYCGVVGPMLMGATIRFLQERFDPGRAAAFAMEEGVTNLMSAPTAHRALVPHLDGTRIRVASSAGEPLPPDVAAAFSAATGARLLDQYGQSEVGMVLGNHHGLDHPVVPGTMGLPLPGFRLAVLGADGRPVREEPGDLAIHLRDSPLNFFGGYLDRGSPVDAGGWYRTGDVATQASAGHFRFASRGDDVILTAGYRVGPSEVEAALMTHPAVGDCAVVGVPDPARGQAIAAFVVPTDGVDGATLEADLRAHVKQRLAAHLAPRVVVVRDTLPRTPSGKVQRYLLRGEVAG